MIKKLKVPPANIRLVVIPDSKPDADTGLTYENKVCTVAMRYDMLHERMVFLKTLTPDKLRLLITQLDKVIPIGVHALDLGALPKIHEIELEGFITLWFAYKVLTGELLTDHKTKH